MGKWVGDWRKTFTARLFLKYCPKNSDAREQNENKIFVKHFSEKE